MVVVVVVVVVDVADLLHMLMVELLHSENQLSSDCFGGCT